MKKSLSKALALFLALLAVCSCFSTAVFAGYAIDAKVIYGESSAVIQVTKDKDSKGNQYIYSISPAAAHTGLNVDNTNILEYSGLTEGKVYTVTAKGYVYENGEKVEDEITGGYKTEVIATTQITIKKKATKPSSITTVEITSNSITIKRVKGNEYNIDDGAFTVGTESDSTNITFKDLNQDTTYKIGTRVKETTTAQASEAYYLYITTLQKGDTVQATEPKLQNISKTKITLVKVEGYEYGIATASVNNGGTYKWQSSNEFEGLSAGTIYYFAQRAKAGENQEPNTASVEKHYQTNKRDGYNAQDNLNQSKLTYISNFNNDNSAKLNKTVTVGVNSVEPDDFYGLQTGDTKLIPCKYEIKQNNRVIQDGELKYSKDYDCYLLNAKFSSEDTYVLTITYNVQKYWFNDDNTSEQENKWVSSTPITKDFAIKAVKTNIWKIILETFTNTIPAALVKAGGYLKPVIDFFSKILKKV